MVRLLMILIGLLSGTGKRSWAMNCYQEMNFYHEIYGYGHDIGCTNLNESTITELESFIVYNKVKLTINKSNLTNISSKLFQNIPNTREIAITHSILDLTSREEVFANLKQLEFLTLTHNNIKNISKDVLSNLYNLRTFNISYNNISEIQNGSLKDMQSLQQLDLNKNKISDLNKIPLCEVRQLKRLYMSQNYISTLKNTEILCLDLLNYLILDFNNISELITLSSFRYLTKVSLSHNNIDNLANKFVGLENLEELNLEGNKIKKLTQYNFSRLRMLKRLNIRNNGLIIITEKTFSDLISLEELYLEHNNFTIIPDYNISSLRKLSLSDNHFNFEKQEFHFKSLHELELRSCKIHELSDQKFLYLKSLEFLDLSNNNVRLISLSFMGLVNLYQLNLSSNSLLGLPNNTFSYLNNLKRLDLSQNNLKNLYSSTFNNLTRLEVLDLSYNYLESLSEIVLVPLENLRYINLERNRLKFIDYSVIISLLHSLKLINIRDNSLSCQFLTEMLEYFDRNNISFTVNDRLSDDQENVAGIHCQEDKEVEFAEINNDRTMDRSMNTIFLGVGLIIVLLFICVFIISYRIYVVVKRRRAVYDDIELLDT